VLTEEVGDLLLRAITLGGLQDEVNQCIVGGFYDEVVDFKKQQRGGSGNSLVAIEKSVVLRQVVQLRGRHLVKIRMEELAAKGRLRLGQCRIEQARISQAGSPAV